MKHLKTYKNWGKINESIESLKKMGVTPSKTEPSIFQYTIYRLPEEEEISEFENYPNLTADDIVNGFNYTMVGKGFLSKKTKKMIQDGINMLIDKYPNDNRYKDALELANKII